MKASEVNVANLSQRIDRPGFSEGAEKAKSSKSLGGSGGLSNLDPSAGMPSFKETLQGLNSSLPGVGLQGNLTKQPSHLGALTKPGLEGVKFSNHAVDRMVSRGITFTPDRLQKLNEVVEKAAAKGSKDSLVLMDEAALIVSVKNKTVVTVMDKSNLKENVFTNIDSTVVV